MSQFYFRSFRVGRDPSQRNWMFRGLSEYLTGLSTLDRNVHDDTSTTLSTSDTTTTEDKVTSNKLPELTNSNCQRLPRVELVSLLTDVSGLVREESQFTQYLNYRYSLSKESKPVVLEVLPVDKSEPE